MSVSFRYITDITPEEYRRFVRIRGEVFDTLEGHKDTSLLTGGLRMRGIKVELYFDNPFDESDATAACIDYIGVVLERRPNIINNPDSR